MFIQAVIVVRYVGLIKQILVQAGISVPVAPCFVSHTLRALMRMALHYFYVYLVVTSLGRWVLEKLDAHFPFTGVTNNQSELQLSGPHFGRVY